jgi:hypothetical protein
LGLRLVGRGGKPTSYGAAWDGRESKMKMKMEMFVWQMIFFQVD